MKNEDSFGINLSVPLLWIGMKEDRNCPCMSRHKDVILCLL